MEVGTRYANRSSRVDEKGTYPILSFNWRSGNTGRFISPDPIGLFGQDGNLYRYVGNNPILFVDPEGLKLSQQDFQEIEAIVDNAKNGVKNAFERFTPGGSLSRDLRIAADVSEVVLGLSAGIALATGASVLSVPILIVGGIAVGTRLVSIGLSDRPFAGLQEFATGRFYSAGLAAIGATFPTLNTISTLTDIGKSINDLLGNFGDTLTESFTNVADNTGEFVENIFTPDNEAQSKGEPHLTTFDGVGYDFQGAGDFTLVESLDGDLDVQIRYVQIDDNVTVASAVATEVDGQNVVIDSEGIEFVEDPNNPGNLIPQVTRGSGRGEAVVTVDGAEVEIASGGSIDVGNSRIYRNSGEKYTIVYAGENGVLEDGDDQLVVDYLRPGTINIVNVYLGDEQQGQITGLLGNLNGNPDDDIALRDGTVLPRPLEFDRLYGDYRDNYRVTSIEESLFTYEAGQNPDTFYNPNFPEAPYTYDDLTPELKAKGDAAALEAGYEPGTFEFESVAFDFAVTHDPGFLEGRETDLEAIGVDIVDDDGVVVGDGTASISGIKFNDLNGNGVRDSELVQGANPDIIFTIDVSFSTQTAKFQGTTDVGDLNNDGSENDIIDAEIAGFIALNQQLIEDGLGDTANVGIVTFSSSASQLDLNPATDGIQLTTTPNADNNNNGILDVEEILQSLQGGGLTDFSDALLAAEQSFIDLGTQPGNGNLIFLSDGQDGSNLDEELGRLNDLGINVSAFGVGNGASIDNLRDLDSEAEVFTSTDELLASFGGVSQGEDGGESESSIEPGLEGVTIYLDLNDNGELDDNEPSQVTDENGEYSFTGLEAGSYIVREVVPDNSTQTTPIDGQFTIDLEQGDVVEGTNFGNTIGETIEAPDNSEQNSLTGVEIQLQAFSPNLETPISEAVTATIGDGVEFGALPSIELPGETLVDVNIDITQEGEGIGSIFFEVDPNETFTSFASGEFNGYVFTDISEQIPAIENVTIDELTNTLGLDASDITFTENSIEVNVESLTFNPEDTLLLNVEFADV